MVDQTPQDGGAAWAGERVEGGTPGRPDQVVKGKPGELITTETDEKEHFSMEMRSGVMQVKEVSKKENQQTFLPVLEVSSSLVDVVGAFLWGAEAKQKLLRREE